MYVKNKIKNLYIKDFKEKLVSGRVVPMYVKTKRYAYDFASKQEAFKYLKKVGNFCLDDYEFEN